MGVRPHGPLLATVLALVVGLPIAMLPPSAAMIPGHPVTSMGRVTVVPHVNGATVSWRAAARKYRVRVQAQGRPWRRVATTTHRRIRLADLDPDRRYRASITGLRAAGWRRLAGPSAWFAPRAAGGTTPAVPVPPATGDQPGAPTPGPWTDPGTTPPPQAVSLWVSPLGDDSAAGSQVDPVRTITEAWNRIPRGTDLTAPHWIQIQPGTYAAADMPGYFEERHGTAQNPIVFNAPGGTGTVTLTGDINAFDVRHLALQDLDIVRSGDVFHCEQCSNVQLRRMRLDGGGAAHETVKVNQSDNILIAGSDISGAYENAIDFVAVQYATISGNRIHRADDWCAYVKGGSTGILVQGNEIHDCGTGGFTAGQGTGFEFMVSPWLHYEAYGVVVLDNVIHDTYGAGLGVNGGANIVMAFNTLYRVGARSHTVEFVHGSRSCDGDTTTCRRHHDLGGWGDAGLDGQWIPSRRIAFVNNVVYNPPGAQSRWSHLQVAEATTPPAGSNVPAPSRADDELVIRGNVFRNGTAEMDSGWGDDTEFLAANHINDLAVDFVDPAVGDFRPTPGSALATLASVPIPVQAWADPTVPQVEPPVIDINRPPGARRP